MIGEFTDEIVNAIEEHSVAKSIGLARDAGIPEVVVKEIARESRYAPATKKGLQVAIPKVMAKYLNKTGVSAEWAPEAALVLSLGSAFVQHRKSHARLEELIQKFKTLKQEHERKSQPSPANQTASSAS